MQHHILLLKEKISLSKTLLLIILAISALMLTACKNSNSPEQVVTDFYKAVGKNDAKAAIKLIYVPQKSRDTPEVRTKFTMIVSNGYEGMKQHKGIKNIKIGEVRYSEDKKQATMTVNLKFNDGEEKTESARAINEEGKWFIKI